MLYHGPEVPTTLQPGISKDFSQTKVVTVEIQGRHSSPQVSPPLAQNRSPEGLLAAQVRKYLDKYIVRHGTEEVNMLSAAINEQKE